MSIRRVSDLPQLVKEEANPEGFQNSFMEISYLSNMSDEYERYESRKIKVKDMVSAMSEVVLTNPKISGNVYINTHLDEYSPDLYEIDIRASTIKILSKTPTYIRSLSTDNLSSTNLKIVNDYDPSTINDYDGINYKFLTSYIEQRLAGFRGGIQFPLLSFIFSDHVIDSDEWKIAGSQVNFSGGQYQTLKNEILENGNLKEKYRKQPSEDSTDPENDTWYYTYSSNTLTLPKAQHFFRAIGNDVDNQGGIFTPCHAPNITGSIMSKTRAQNEKEPFTFSDTLTSKGSLKASKKESANSYGVRDSSLTLGSASRGITFDASKSSYVYKDGVEDIVPDYVQVYVYFYVGPKNL